MNPVVVAAFCARSARRRQVPCQGVGAAWCNARDMPTKYLPPICSLPAHHPNYLPDLSQRRSEEGGAGRTGSRTHPTHLSANHPQRSTRSPYSTWRARPLFVRCPAADCWHLRLGQSYLSPSPMACSGGLNKCTGFTLVPGRSQSQPIVRQGSRSKGDTV